MIVLLLPSRGRPQNVKRLHASLVATAWGDWRMIVELDEDDPSDYPPLLGVDYVIGPRRLLATYWNDAYADARLNLPHEDEDGPTIYMHVGDDVEFRTLGWDRIVRGAFPADGIAYVHGHDLTPNGATLGTQGCLRAEWIETVGYMVPPYFSADCTDSWLNDVADLLGRRIYVPIVHEHHHPTVGKAEWDQTHQERLARHAADDVTGIWWDKAPDRYADAAKLRAVMDREAPPPRYHNG